VVEKLNGLVDPLFDTSWHKWNRYKLHRVPWYKEWPTSLELLARPMVPPCSCGLNKQLLAEVATDKGAYGPRTEARCCGISQETIPTVSTTDHHQRIHTHRHKLTHNLAHRYIFTYKYTYTIIHINTHSRFEHTCVRTYMYHATFTHLIDRYTFT